MEFIKKLDNISAQVEQVFAGMNLFHLQLNDIQDQLFVLNNSDQISSTLFIT